MVIGLLVTSILSSLVATKVPPCPSLTTALGQTHPVLSRRFYERMVDKPFLVPDKNEFKHV